MTTIRMFERALLAGLLAATLGAGCGDDDDDTGVTPDAGNPDADVSFVCDPVGGNPAMGALLNEPVDSDVEVIQKPPQHPGNPGPDDLP